MGIILSSVAGLGSLACWIMVLIKMFKAEKPLIAILGILCPLWAFIWGWMNSTKQDLKKIMLAWTGAIVLSVIGNALTVSSVVSSQGGLPVAPTSAPAR